MRHATLLALLLSGCTSIVPTTVMRLNALDPLTVDPADLAVAITMPDGLDVIPGSATVTFAVSRSDTGETHDGVLVLKRQNDEQTVFSVAPGDYATMRAFQETARQWEDENDGATEGSIGVGLLPCKRGNGPGDDARVSVAIRMAQDGAFLPLVRNGPISAVAEPEEIRDMDVCP